MRVRAPHLEELVGLVEHEPPDAGEGYLSGLHQSREAERVGDEDVEEGEVAPCGGGLLEHGVAELLRGVEAAEHAVRLRGCGGWGPAEAERE